jgi:hypothetical protein
LSQLEAFADLQMLTTSPRLMASLRARNIVWIKELTVLVRDESLNRLLKPGTARVPRMDSTASAIMSSTSVNPCD